MKRALSIGVSFPVSGLVVAIHAQFDLRQQGITDLCKERISRRKVHFLVDFCLDFLARRAHRPVSSRFLIFALSFFGLQPLLPCDVSAMGGLTLWWALFFGGISVLWDEANGKLGGGSVDSQDIIAVLLDAQVEDDTCGGRLEWFQKRLLELVAVNSRELFADHSAHQVEFLKFLVFFHHSLLSEFRLCWCVGVEGLLWISPGADNKLEIRVLVPRCDPLSEANIESSVHRHLVIAILA